MEDQVREILLNGMSIPKFMAFYLASLLGAFIWLLIKTMEGIAKDPKTPKKFSLKHATKGLIKFVITLLVLPWAILYFPDYGPTILDTLFILPDGKTLIELNAGSAFVMGMSIDAFLRKIIASRLTKLPTQ